LLPPRPQNRPTSARTEKCDGRANLAEKLRRWPNVAATCANLKIIINTKGTIGDISDELKAVIQYLDSGVASTEYTRALDAEVESVKSDEKVRMQYMLLMEAYAQHEELGAYKKVVSVIRDHGAGKHRARYHSSCMDVENLDAGQKFDELPDTYTIFITEHDVFKKGKALYPIERINLGTQEMFDDGEHILYVNGQYRDDSEIGKLMHDFSCWDPDDMNYDLLKEATRYYKENPKGVEIMCRAFEETRNEGAMRQAIIIAERLIAKGQMTLDAISEITDLPLEKVQELASAKTA